MAADLTQSGLCHRYLPVALALALLVVPVAADERSGRDAPSIGPRLLVGPIDSVHSAASHEEVWASVEPAEPNPSSARPDPGSAATNVDDRPLSRGNKSKRISASSTGTTPSASQWPRTILATLGVGALIVLLAWGYRAATTGPLAGLGRPRSPGAVQLICRQALSPRQSVCLLRVGPRMVLIGLSPDRMTALDVITDADTVASLSANANAGAGRTEPQFQRELEREAAAYEAPRPTLAAPAASPERLIAARTKLLSAIERLRNEDAPMPMKRGVR